MKKIHKFILFVMTVMIVRGILIDLMVWDWNFEDYQINIALAMYDTMKYYVMFSIMGFWEEK